MRASPPRALGRAAEEWIGQPVVEFVHPDDRAAIVDLIAAVDPAGSPSPDPVVFRAFHAAGHWVTLEVAGIQRPDTVGASGIVAVFRDISARVDAERHLHQTEKRLEFAVSHDPITGLPNRVAMEQRLHALARSVDGSRRPAHLLMAKVADVDELRDRYGLIEADHMFRTLGWAVRAEVGPDDLVATDGVGEFVVLVGPGPSAFDVDELAWRLLGLAGTSRVGWHGTGSHLVVGVTTLRSHQGESSALDQLGRAARRAVATSAIAPVVFDERPRRAEVIRRPLAADVGRGFAPR